LFPLRRTNAMTFASYIPAARSVHTFHYTL
jgi:hypothetical protein